MAAFRRAFVNASNLLKQSSRLTRAHCKTLLQTQARSLTVQQSLLVKRVSAEGFLAKPGPQKLSSIPRIVSPALMTKIIATADTGLISGDSSGLSEALEGSGSDEEGLVTPVLGSRDDL